MKSLKNIIKKYFSSFVYFYKYLSYRLFVVVALSIAIGALDAFGLSMFLPLLQLTDGNSEASGEGLGSLGFIVDWIRILGWELNLKIALLILFLFFILKGIAVYLSSVYKVIVNQYFASKLRFRLTNLFANFSFKRFISSDVGRIQNSFTSEIPKVTGAYNSYSNCIQQLCMAFVYLIFVFLVDWGFALLVCIGGVITNFLYSSIYRKTKKQSAELTKNNNSYHGLIIQYVTNFKYLKATGLSGLYSYKLKTAIKSIENTNKKIGILNAQVSSSREPLLISVVCMVIIVQVYGFGGNLASVLVSLLFFYRALTSLMAFQNYYNSFLGASGALDNISVFEEELKSGAEIKGTIKFDKFKQDISLQDLDFGYDNYKILKKINLVISKKQSVAFIGESGSGKTTLVNLICGLLQPDSGQVLVDDMDIKSLIFNTYQSRIGYIAQEPVIFNDTIFNNVTFWDEPTVENKQKFKKAIQKALINEFIYDLNDKEFTLLGNNGINLSGGQKQRISIARELYKDIDILILDEATSALDSETEKEIQNNIDQLKGDYTLIIIAHRLSTIKNVDIVYLMDSGQIIGSGNFNQLLLSSDKFRRMVELQEV